MLAFAIAVNVAGIALLRLQPQEVEAIVQVDDIFPEEPTSTIARDRIGTTKAIFRSDALIRRALRSEKVAALPLVAAESDPVTWLRDELELNEDRDHPESRIRISLRGRDPEPLITIINTLIDTYLDILEAGARADNAGSHHYGFSVVQRPTIAE